MRIRSILALSLTVHQTEELSNEMKTSQDLTDLTYEMKSSQDMSDLHNL